MKGLSTDQVSRLPTAANSKLPEESAKASFQGWRPSLKKGIPEY